ncbi:MAG: hypothetical protein B0W54_19305, partial [Cellvibrio sp. 79]
MQWFVKFTCLVWFCILSFTVSALDIDLSRYKIREADPTKNSQIVIANAAAPRFASNSQVPAEFNYLLTASSVPDVGAGQLVATTRGGLNVANGAASYSIPIDLPPAVHNLKPNLSVNYNSRSGNGLMGVGWNLNGLSAITRCRASFATEGAEAQKSNPRYSTGDRLCLDGQKLVVASSTTAASNSAYWSTNVDLEYKTELDNFAKIVAYGSSANGGHGYFKVWTKDGRILTYGAEEYLQASKIYAPNQYAGPIKTWALDKVEDAYGNNYTITYDRDTVNGEYYPQQINLGYTGLVVFSYQSRNGQMPWGYDGGNKYQFTKVLDKVTTYVGGTTSSPIKQYDIDYKISVTTNRELVEKISECGYDSGWKCARPLTFDWQDGELGFENNATTLRDNSGQLITGVVLLEDLNGDGFVDILGKAGIKAWGEPGGGFTPITHGAFEQFLIIDTALGKAAITAVDRKVNNVTYRDFSITRFAKGAPMSSTLLVTYSDTNVQLYVHDFNNDGLSDLNFRFGNDFAASRVWTQSTAGQFTQLTTNAPSGQGREVKFFDFSDDGLDDHVLVNTWEHGTTDPQNYIYGIKNLGSQGFSNSTGLFHRASPTPPANLIPGSSAGNPRGGAYVASPGFWSTWVDINNDGKLDLLVQDYEPLGPRPTGPGIPTNWVIRVSTGGTGGFTGMPLLNTGKRVIRSESSKGQYVYVYDYNKDGQQDIVLVSSVTRDSPTSPIIWLMTAQVASYTLDQPGLVRFVDTGVDPFLNKVTPLWATAIETDPELANILKGDANNDGLLDMFIPSGGSFNVYLAKQQQPDLINKITDGFGAETKIAYSPLTGDANNGAPLYTPDSTAPVFPQAPINRGMQVVKQVSVSNGQNGFNHSYFNYVGGVRDLLRGSSGFKSIVITNAASRVISTTEYRQDWPYTGRIKKQTVKESSGRLISITDNSYALHSQNSRFPYLQYSLQKNYALSTFSDSSPIGVSKTSNTFDVCGNLTDQTTSVGSGFSGVDITGELSNQHTVNEYDSYSTPACNDDFLTRTTQDVTKAGADLKSVVTEFTANSQGDVRTRIDFKGEAIQKTTTYDRETNGVVNQITETASDVNGVQTPERITAFSDLAYSIHPQTVTNAENHTTSFTYDYRFGSVATQTFLGLTTTNTYDALGRLQQQQTPDNTVTKTTAFYCSNAPVTCPSGAYYGVASRVTNSTPSQVGKLGEPLSITFYDALQREVRSVVYSLNGKVINQASEYDAKGYLIRVSEPYATDGIVADTSLATAWTNYYGYDSLGRATTITSADGGSKTTTYSTDGYGFKTSESILVIKPGSASETQTTNSWTNALGQVTRVEDALLNTVSYSYDTLGNLQTTLVNNDVATQIDIQHDLAGNKTSINDPDAGKINFDYNGFGELRKQTWQKNVVGAEKYIAYAYDRLGRQVLRIDQPASGGYIGYSWVWDTKQHGQLSSRSGNGFSEEYFYDGFSRLSRRIVTATALSGGEFVYTYDNFGREETVKYPNGFKIQRDYHTDGYQVQTRDVTVAATPKVLWTLGSSIDARGIFNNQLWGNGVVTQTGFDATSGRLSSIKSGRLTSTNTLTNLYGNIQNLSYTFDSLGNLSSRTTARTNDYGVALENITEAYSYDALNRVTTSSTSGLFGRTQTFQYDTVGNLINRSDVLTGSSINNDVGELKYDQVRNASIHAVTSANGMNYSYDKYGNMTARGGESITYNTFNKPIRIEGASIT